MCVSVTPGDKVKVRVDKNGKEVGACSFGPPAVINTAATSFFSVA